VWLFKINVKKVIPSTSLIGAPYSGTAEKSGNQV